MKKIIVYGYGRKYQQLKNDLFGCEIVAFADKNAKELSVKENGKMFILPSEINDYEYDYVAISLIGSYEQVKQQLVGENNVDEDKIISLMMFVENNAADLKTYESQIREVLLSVDENNPQVRAYDTCPKTEMTGRRISLSDALLYVDDSAHYYGEDTSIYVVTHNEYKVFSDEDYVPITVGDYHRNDYLWEQQGDNISYLNSKINECTAIYWIWKNSESKIVGTNHYRRYFYNNELRCRENRLCGTIAEQILDEFDMIVYKAAVPNNQTVEEEMRTDLSNDAFIYGYKSIVEGLKEYQPEYIDDFYAVMGSKECCYCNMLVTRKELFDAYCEWLFSFLIPVAEQADVSKYNSHDARVVGFFAERMLSVWLHHNPIRIKPLPVFVP